jgi:hypothetical protein
MIKRFVSVALAIALVAVVAAASVSALTRKPLGYSYGKCTTQANCSLQVGTNVSQNKASFSSAKLCVTGRNALSALGYVSVRHGHFSVNKTVQADSTDLYTKIPVQIQLSGTLKVAKRATGTLKITTTAADCTADSGVARKFSLAYAGPFYGG